MRMAETAAHALVHFSKGCQYTTPPRPAAHAVHNSPCHGISKTFKKRKYKLSVLNGMETCIVPFDISMPQSIIDAPVVYLEWKRLFAKVVLKESQWTKLADDTHVNGGLTLLKGKSDGKTICYMLGTGDYDTLESEFKKLHSCYVLMPSAMEKVYIHFAQTRKLSKR